MPSSERQENDMAATPSSTAAQTLPEYAPVPPAAYQQYVADIVDSAQAALGAVDPTPYFVEYGANVWAGVKVRLDLGAGSQVHP
jgi:hypothetical protein